MIDVRFSVLFVPTYTGREVDMADVTMPASVPCTFDSKGWQPCKKPSTNGMCTKHENARCEVCKTQAIRSCDAEMGGLCCGTLLCGSCKHSLEDGTHVTGEVYAVQFREREETRKTGHESDRILAQRGVPTDIKLPRHLAELLDDGGTDFELKMCYNLEINHGLMGYFPVIVKNSKIMVVTPDRETIMRIWASLEPRDSKLNKDPWMVHKTVNVGYAMCTGEHDQKRSTPHKVFTREEVDALFQGNPAPFKWAPGLLGAGISPDQFRHLIQANAG